MKFPVPFHPEATQDLADAVDWYEDQGPGLGLSLAEAVDHALCFGVPLAAPSESARTGLDLRRYLVSDYDYTIFVRVRSGKPDFVLAVAHQSRDPDYWLDRASPRPRRRQTRRPRR